MNKLARIQEGTNRAKKRIVENTNKKSNEDETQKYGKIYLFYYFYLYLFYIRYLEKVTYIKGKEKRKQNSRMDLTEFSEIIILIS